MIKIILVEDHHIVRKGIRLLISEDPEIEIVAEAANGLEALEALKKHQDVKIVLADLNMPVVDGRTLILDAMARHPSVKVIILSMVDDHNIIADIIKNGAAGYLFKNSDAMELIFAIKFVSNGSRFVCSDLGIDLLNTLQKNNDKIGLQDKSEYSNRELEVLQLIADGLTNSEIADKIFISKRTVETHRQCLLEKTGSRNTAVLIKNAVLRGLI